MKKIIAIVCMFSLLITGTVFANFETPEEIPTDATQASFDTEKSSTVQTLSETKTKDDTGADSSSDTSVSNTNNNINYADIYNLVLAYNSTIKSNELSLEVMKSPPGLSAASSALFSVYQGVSSVKSSVDFAMQGVDKTDPLYLALSAGSMSLQFTMNDLSSQMNALNGASDTEIEKTEEQFKQIANQIVWGAQSLYVTYLNLDIQKDELIANLNSLNDTIKIMEKRFELGQIAELDLINLKANRATLESGIKTLEFECKNLISELNVMLGRSFSASLTLSDNISADLSYYSKINFANDLDEVLKNNYSYSQKEQAVKDASKIVDREDNKASRNNLDLAKLNLETEQQKISQSHTKLYNAISEKTRLLDVEKATLANRQKNLDAMELKYELGTISKQELDTERTNLNSQVSKVKSAEFSLFLAIEQYKWAKLGMITG